MNTDWAKKIAKAAAALLYGCQPCPAEPLVGYDTLALARYCDTYLQAPELPAVSTLMTTFGNPIPCLKKALSKKSLKLVQIDLKDATCWRNKTCPPNTSKLTDWADIARKSRQISRLAKAYPSTEFWISPWLEHDIKSPTTIRKACTVALRQCKTCKCVNSPHTGSRPKEIALELHGTTTTAFMISADGASTFEADTLSTDGNQFNHAKAGSYATFAWWYELNLRCSGEETFTAPQKRTEQPTIDQFQQAFEIVTTEEAKPEPPRGKCKKERPLDAIARETSRPNARNNCNGQPKPTTQNKAILVIRPIGTTQPIPILDRTGNQVGCFRHSGTPSQDGLEKWYIAGCSDQTPSRLRADLRGEWGWVQLPNQDCIPINAIRRTGSLK